MNTSKPEEYISLSATQNYFEIYDKMPLKDEEAMSCRFAPRHGFSCSYCSNETFENHGFTTFSKDRFDIVTMRIIGIL